MSSFFSLTGRVLMEVDYDQLQFNNVSHPLFVISDENEGTKILVNGGADPMFTFNNPERSAYVNHSDGSMSVAMGSDTAFYYPNLDGNISKSQIPSVNIGLKYIRINLHILAGYVFQDSLGLAFNVYTLDKNNKRVYLLKQVFRKGEINRFSYNETAKNIGDLYYDKFLSFVVVDYNDILTAGINSGFFQNQLDFGTSPALYAELYDLSSIDNSLGYEKLNLLETITLSFPTRDDYDLLVASIEENENGYLEYCAKWDNQSIEDFIFRINSINGNNYYIIHELDVYGQIGNSLVHIDTITQIQTGDFDECKKLRPILPNSINGSMKVDYTVRLLNKNNGDSIIKKSSISIQNIGSYLESIERINIQQSSNPIKVYSKIVNEKAEKMGETERVVKIVSPIYVNSFGVTLGEAFVLPLEPFDNFYVLTIYQTNGGSVGLFPIDPKFKHSMVFIRPNGGKITIDEVLDPSKRSNSKLSFKIDESTARSVLSNSIKNFYITAKSSDIETVLLKGDIRNA
jgi:hypothetical protein